MLDKTTKNILSLLVLALLILFPAACGLEEDDEEETTTETSTNDESADDNEEAQEPAASATSAGKVIKDIDTAMASVASSTNLTGGVATDYCNENGGPQASSADLESTDTNYASATGFCQASHNSQSPDTPRGAMYLTGAIACSAAEAGLFDELEAGSSNTESVNLTVDTTCFGTQAEVDAMVADMGTDTIPNMNITVTQLASTAAYDYQLSFTEPGDNGGQVTLYIKNSDNIKAALYASATDPWFVKMDSSTSSVSVQYEGINTANTRRMRVLIEGALDTNGVFSTISSISGFWVQGNNSEYNRMVTFTGDLTNGLLGMGYQDGQDNVDNGGSGYCHVPGSSATCAGLTAIGASNTAGNSLITNASTSATALASETDTIISITEIDPSDYDITD